MNIRKAKIEDLSRIAEIYIFNNRVNYFPIFKDEEFSFGELQVVSLIDHYFKNDEVIKNIYVFDNGLIKGFIQIDAHIHNPANRPSTNYHRPKND